MIQANITDYQVELYSKKIGKTFEYICNESPCVLSDISPLSYNVRVRKDGYSAASQNIEMKARTRTSITIDAIKDVSLLEVKTEEETLSNKDKISSLRDKKKAYKYFDLEVWSYAYFSDEWSLYVYRDSTTEKIWDFSFTETDILDFKSISDSTYVYFQIADKKYLYDLQRGNIQLLDLWVRTNYIKPGNTSWELVFVTPVGSYVYNIDRNSFEYFYLFKDFVYTNNNYIWVIYADEDKKLQNFDLQDKTSNLIIRYNLESKEKEILYETSINIDRIYLQDWGVRFESEGDLYQLENI